MVKLLNSIGLSALVYGIYLGISLFTPNLPKDNAIKENHKVVKENKRLIPPKEAPKAFNPKVISKLEMIDSSDIIIEDHITSILEKSKYGCLGKSRKAYAADFSSSVLNHSKGDMKLALWITAMAQVESSYRINADPRVSSARGYLQVIYRYHQKELSKAGISKEDLSTSPSKSIHAGIIVFRKYLKLEHGNYRFATDRYRGLSVPKKERDRYYAAISAIYDKLLKELNEYA